MSRIEKTRILLSLLLVLTTKSIYSQNIQCNNCGGASATITSAQININGFSGNEPITISSTDANQQSLFNVQAPVGSVSLTASNPAGQSKDNTAGTYWPTLTPPNCTNNNAAGYIQLTFSPATGQNLNYTNLVFTTEAKFANNPPRLLVKSSADQYASTIATIRTANRVTSNIAIPSVNAGQSLGVRLVADDDDCSNGGGDTGFRGGIISLVRIETQGNEVDTPATFETTVTSVPIMPIWLLGGLAVLLGLIGLRRLN